MYEGEVAASTGYRASRPSLTIFSWLRLARIRSPTRSTLKVADRAQHTVDAVNSRDFPETASFISAKTKHLWRTADNIYEQW